MLPVIMFLIGLFVLFKGGFRFGSRIISFAQSRSIALMLMAPLVLGFCASSIIAANMAINDPDLVMSMMSEDGGLNLNSEVLNSVADSVGTVQLIAVIGALVFIGISLYNAPTTDAAPIARPQQAASLTTNVPDIMTVAETAAYMRVTESEVMKLIEEGRLGAAKIGNSYRIARIAVDDFMRRA